MGWTGKQTGGQREVVTEEDRSLEKGSPEGGARLAGKGRGQWLAFLQGFTGLVLWATRLDMTLHSRTMTSYPLSGWCQGLGAGLTCSGEVRFSSWLWVEEGQG